MVFGLVETCFKPHNSTGTWFSNFVDLIFNTGLVASYYTVCSSSISVGDKVNIFGLLRLDKDSDVLFIDKPLAYFSGCLKDGIDSFKNSLWGTQLRNIGSVFLHSMAAMGCLALAY